MEDSPVGGGEQIACGGQQSCIGGQQGALGGQLIGDCVEKNIIGGV